jgi:hypothetical protein
MAFVLKKPFCWNWTGICRSESNSVIYVEPNWAVMAMSQTLSQGDCAGAVMK